MSEQKEIPVKDDRGWTCPNGFAHPRCSGCGHNFYEAKPQPLDAKGFAVKTGLCNWCAEEVEQ